MENTKNSLIECKLCNFTTNSNKNWLKHINTEKHKRNGDKKKTKCEICDHECISHWNLKIHHITNHATLEERKKYKYYCKDCDTILFCKAYYDKHINGIKHNLKIKVNESLEQLEKQYEELKIDDV
jgi:uncharacterized C2H2 Zn-finger protein